jgi:glc operon protein GlcG
MEAELGLAAAQRIVDQAVGEAARHQLRISVAVADEAGALLAFARMDGATRLSARTAADKTQTVILTGKATLDLGREFREQLDEEPELFHGMISRPEVVPFGGGVPVRISGRLAGAVAVSGATSIQDHQIAELAAQVISSPIKDQLAGEEPVMSAGG